LVLEESAWTIVQTSLSTAVHEAWDFSVLIFDRRGRIVAQNTTVAGKWGVWNTVIDAIHKNYDQSDLHQRDVFITNDPWIAEGHLYDVNASTPLFHNGRIVGFGATVAHLSDIGGRLGN